MKITVGQLSVIADYFNKMTDDRNDKVNITVTDIGLLFETETVKASVAFNNRPEPKGPQWGWIIHDGGSRPDMVNGMNEIEIVFGDGSTGTYNSTNDFRGLLWNKAVRWRRAK